MRQLSIIKKYSLVKKLAFFGLLAFYFSISSAQNVFTKRNSAFFEIAGSTGSLSGICYDRVLSEKRSTFYSVTTGIGYFPSNDENTDDIIGFPIIFNISTSLKKESMKSGYAEFGFGPCYSSGLLQEYFIDRSTGISETKKLEAVFVATRLGLRIQKPTGGFVFKFSFNPMFRLVELNNDYPDVSFILMAGLGLGWSF